MPVSRTRKNRGKGKGAKEQQRRRQQRNAELRDRYRSTIPSDQAFATMAALGWLGRWRPPMSDRCPICEAPVAVTHSLLGDTHSRWDCVLCCAWGDYATLSTEPVEAVRERLKRPAVSMGVEVER